MRILLLFKFPECPRGRKSGAQRLHCSSMIHNRMQVADVDCPNKFAPSNITDNFSTEDILPSGSKLLCDR